jgi:hypothetical protein
MPISSADLLFRYSVQTEAGDDQLNPNASLGGFVSDTAWTGGLDSLFSDVTALENAGDQIDYRCIFLYNSHPSLTLIRPVAWISGTVFCTINIGVDVNPPSPYNSPTAQALTVANTLTAPVGVTFVPATNQKQGLVLGNIPAGMVLAIWIERTAPGTPALGNDKFVLQILGNTLT